MNAKVTGCDIDKPFSCRVKYMKTDFAFADWREIVFANALRLDMTRWLKDRKNALLSMDKHKILEFSKKYYYDDGYEEADEYLFWVGVHKARTGATDLPEAERRKSMAWLAEHGLGHFASDLEKKDAGRTSLSKRQKFPPAIFSTSFSEKPISCSFSYLFIRCL